MNENLPDEKIAIAWTAIQKAIRDRLAPKDMEGKEALTKIVTVTKGSDDLSTYVRFGHERSTVGQPKVGQTNAERLADPQRLKLTSTLDCIYELRFTKCIDRMGLLAPNDELNVDLLADLPKWGELLRTEERDWVLRLLLDQCQGVAELRKNEQLFKEDRALRVIPFEGSWVDDLKKLRTVATLEIAEQRAAPPGYSNLAALVVPITDGPQVVRVEDFELWHTVTSSQFIVSATARYQLVRFSPRGAKVGKRYARVDLA